MNMKANIPGTGGKRGKSATWFTAKASGNGKANIVIDKVIGSDWLPDWFNEENGQQSARMFIDSVEALGDLKEINLEINSPGGDVYAGLRIYNYLQNHKAKVYVTVTGVAASIASVILMAGDTRTMGIGTQVMVHNPAGGMSGWFTEDELRQRADELAKVKDAIVEAYVHGTGKTEAEIRQLLDGGDVYLSAAEAVDWGFATATDEKIQAAAFADPRDLQLQAKMQAKVRELTSEVSAKRASLEALTQKYEAAQKELEALRPVPAKVDYVIEACDKAALPALAIEMVKQKLSQSIVDQRLALAAQVRDIAKAAHIEAEPLLAHINDPIQMMRVAITEAKAEGDDDVSTYHHSHSSAALSNIYDQLNTPYSASWTAAFKRAAGKMNAQGEPQQ